MSNSARVCRNSRFGFLVARSRGTKTRSCSPSVSDVASRPRTDSPSRGEAAATSPNWASSAGRLSFSRLSTRTTQRGTMASQAASAKKIQPLAPTGPRCYSIRSLSLTCVQIPANKARLYTSGSRIIVQNEVRGKQCGTAMLASDEYDFAAEGDHGQYIYVSPYKNLVIVRNGVEVECGRSLARFDGLPHLFDELVVVDDDGIFADLAARYPPGYSSAKSLHLVRRSHFVLRSAPKLGFPWEKGDSWTARETTFSAVFGAKMRR